METGRQSPIVAGPRKTGFYEDFRRFFVRGLATLLPTLITILLLVKAWEILWDYLGQHIIGAIKLIHSYFRPEWEVPVIKWRWDQVPEWQQETLGVILAIVLVYIVGLFVGHLLGRTAWRLMEVVVMRVPLIRAIYPAVKQVTDFVLADRTTHLKASRVVAVQPHADGIWSLGLITGPGLRSLSEVVGSEMVTVFVPSSPTAFTGYVLVVPRERVVELPLSVEEVMRMLVTGGVSGPVDADKAGPGLEQPGGWKGFLAATAAEVKAVSEARRE